MVFEVFLKFSFKNESLNHFREEDQTVHGSDLIKKHFHFKMSTKILISYIFDISQPNVQ